MSYWCHGAAGIGLARVACHRHLKDEELVTEIQTAIDTTIATAFGFNHSLCHGDLGNLDLLVKASAMSDGLELPIDPRMIAAQILASIRQRGWVSGHPLGLEDPGLMMGLSGIGYGLLRLADPDRVPSVLLLEAPLP
jgi:lantibiotic modifying enzyme